jgi:hypothetical protein
VDRRIDPNLATDLSKVSDEALAADLSKSAIEARALKRRLDRAGRWARTMNRTFKGISGSNNRREYVLIALDKHGISLEDLERVA